MRRDRFPLLRRRRLSAGLDLQWVHLCRLHRQTPALLGADLLLTLRVRHHFARADLLRQLGRSVRGLEGVLRIGVVLQCRRR